MVEGYTPAFPLEFLLRRFCIKIYVVIIYVIRWFRRAECVGITLAILPLSIYINDQVQDFCFINFTSIELIESAGSIR